MSIITGVVLVALLLSVIDYMMMFHYESKRWEWFTKKTRIQKVGLFTTVFIALFILNYVTSS